MVPIEIMLTIVFTVLASAMYVMWRYFDDLFCGITSKMDCQEENRLIGLLIEKELLIKRIELTEQKLKDGLQSNSLCCRSAIDRISSRLSLLEADKHGSNKVIVKDKDNGTRKPSTAKNIST